MRQVKVGLTDEQRSRLESSAEINGRTLSEEIRERVAQSLMLDGHVAANVEIGLDVMNIANVISQPASWEKPFDLVHWNQSAHLRDALSAAITTWLSEESLENRTATPGETERWGDAQTLGRTTARLHRQWKIEREKLLASSKRKATENEQ